MSSRNTCRAATLSQCTAQLLSAEVFVPVSGQKVVHGTADQFQWGLQFEADCRPFLVAGFNAHHLVTNVLVLPHNHKTPGAHALTLVCLLYVLWGPSRVTQTARDGSSGHAEHK